MLGTFLKKTTKSSILNIPKFRFSILDGEYYRKNFEDSLLRNSILQRRVNFKPEPTSAPQDIEIYGIPLKPLPELEEKITSSLKSLFNKRTASPIFLQVDPTRYLYYERKVTRNADTPLVEKEEVQKLLREDPIHPFTWEEAIVDPGILAKYFIKEAHKTEANEKEKQDKESPIDPKILIDYVEKMGIPHDKADERVHTIIKVVNDRILDNQPVGYYELNNVLFYSLIGGEKVVLGAMPKIFKRLAIGNSLSLENLQEMFKNCCENLHKFRQQKASLGLSDIVTYMYPEVFHASEVLYMIVYLKEIAKHTKKGFRAFVGIDFADPIADNWKSPEIEGVEFADILGIPDRLEGENADILIEKQAILDVLLEENVWGLSYLHNKFPYLTHEESAKGKVESLKRKFSENFQKYSAERERIVSGSSK